MTSFTLTAVFTGVICYVLGLIFGWFFNNMNNKSNIEQAKKEARAAAEKDFAAEKAEICTALEGKFCGIRDTLIAALHAYDDAVETVDEKLSSNLSKNLALNSQFEIKELDYSDSTKASDETSSDQDLDTMSNKIERTDYTENAVKNLSAANEDQKAEQPEQNVI